MFFVVLWTWLNEANFVRLCGRREFVSYVIFEADRNRRGESDTTEMELTP